MASTGSPMDWNGSQTTMESTIGNASSSMSSGPPVFIRHAFILLTGALGFPTILLLFLVTLTRSYRKQSYSLYLTIMSVYDLVFISLEFTTAVLDITKERFITDYISDEVLCKLYLHLFYATVNISMWLNVGLAVDRMVMILFPLRKRVLCTRRSSWLISAGVLLSIHCIGIAYFVLGGLVYSERHSRHQCSPDLNILNTILSFMCGMLPAIVVIVVCTIMSVVKLSYYNAERRRMAPTLTHTGEVTSKATMSLVSIGVGTVLTRLPLVVTQLCQFVIFHMDPDLSIRLNQGLGPPFFMPLLQGLNGLAYLHFVQNFFILFVMNAQFRTDVLNVLLAVCGRKAASTQPPLDDTELEETR